MPSREPVDLTKEEASAALREAAFTASDGRTTIHSFLSMIGADHDLDRALELVAESTRCAWVDHWCGHDLAVVTNGRLYHYDVRRPEAKDEVDF